MTGLRERLTAAEPTGDLRRRLSTSRSALSPRAGSAGTTTCACTPARPCLRHYTQMTPAEQRAVRDRLSVRATGP